MTRKKRDKLSVNDAWNEVLSEEDKAALARHIRRCMGWPLDPEHEGKPKAKVIPIAKAKKRG